MAALRTGQEAVQAPPHSPQGFKDVPALVDPAEVHQGQRIKGSDSSSGPNCFWRIYGKAKRLQKEALVKVFGGFLKKRECSL